jgi:hypothetical protein
MRWRARVAPPAGLLATCSRKGIGRSATEGVVMMEDVCWVILETPKESQMMELSRDIFGYKIFPDDLQKVGEHA